MQEQQVEDLEIRLFLEAINARYGYDFRNYASRSMQRRVAAVLSRSGLSHLGELQHRVLTNPEQFAWVLELLTIQVTDLFRDPEFYLAFRERVVPVLRTYPQIKIWIAGCATGEEVYSMAILLMDEGLHGRAQIYGTDLSASALNHARDGVYPETRLEAFTQSYLAAGGRSNFDTYLSRAYGNLTFTEAVRRSIVFFQHDLVSDAAPGEMQVILCRNVLIYFNATLRQRVMKLFGSSLCRNGFLCLGRSETVPLEGHDGFVPFVRERRIYRCEEAGLR